MAKKSKGFVFDHQTITIRGSFINMLFTMVMMGLFIASAASSNVAANIKMVAEPLIAIYAISYGVWQTKKYLEDRDKKKEEEPKE